MKLKLKICLIVVFFITSIPGFILKDKNLYERGGCFTRKMSNFKDFQEEWNFKEKDSLVEFVVLKVGKTNYLTHSSFSRMEEVPIVSDVVVKKSDCSIIYQRR